MNWTHLYTRLVRHFITFPVIKFLIRKSKKIYLPGFRGIPVFDVIRFFFQQIKRTGMTERASSIAFNIVLSLPPSLIFLFTLIPFLPIQGFESELNELVRAMIPAEKDNEAIIKFLSDFLNRPRGGLLSFGFILALYFSSNAMIGIMRSFNKDYMGFRKRNWMQIRGVAIMLTIIVFLLFITTIIVLIARGKVLDWLGIENEFVRTFIINARWSVVLLLFFFIISFIYKYAPAVHKKWKFISPGSLLATIMMLIFTALFSWWVVNFGSYHQLYGSISTILIVMLLIYFNSVVLLIGFELNVSLNSLKRIAEQRDKIVADGKPRV